MLTPDRRAEATHVTARSVLASPPNPERTWAGYAPPTERATARSIRRGRCQLRSTTRVKSLKDAAVQSRYRDHRLHTLRWTMASEYQSLGGLACLRSTTVRRFDTPARRACPNRRGKPAKRAATPRPGLGRSTPKSLFVIPIVLCFYLAQPPGAARLTQRMTTSPRKAEAIS